MRYFSYCTIQPEQSRPRNSSPYLWGNFRFSQFVIWNSPPCLSGSFTVINSKCCLGGCSGWIIRYRHLDISYCDVSHKGNNVTHWNLSMYRIVTLLRRHEELPISKFAVSVGLGSIVGESPRKPAGQGCVRTVEQFLTFILAKRQSR